MVTKVLKGQRRNDETTQRLAADRKLTPLWSVQMDGPRKDEVTDAFRGARLNAHTFSPS